MNKRLILLAVVAITSACHHTYHTATPVDVGSTEVSVSLTARTQTTASIIPSPEAAFRTGISKNSDAGLRFFLAGVGLDYNYALVNTDRFALSLNPEFQVGFIPDFEEYDRGIVYSGNFNVLVDIVKNDALIVTLAARPGITIEEETSFTPGVGALFKLRISKGVAIAPSIDLMRTFEGDVVVGVGVGLHVQ